MKSYAFFVSQLTSILQIQYMLSSHDITNVMEQCVPMLSQAHSTPLDFWGTFFSGPYIRS